MSRRKRSLLGLYSAPVYPIPAAEVAPFSSWFSAAQLKRRDDPRVKIDALELDQYTVVSVVIQPLPAWTIVQNGRRDDQRKVVQLPELNQFPYAPPVPQPITAWTALQNRQKEDKRNAVQLPELNQFPYVPPVPQSLVAWMELKTYYRPDSRKFWALPEHNLYVVRRITGVLNSTLASVLSTTSGAVEAANTGALISTLGPVTGVMEGTVSGDAEVELPMTTRIVDIITRARDTLADPRKERWSDERLLRLLDEAQTDLAIQSELLKGTYEFSLTIGQSDYTLPDDVWLITRATFDNKEIKLWSYDKLDEMLNWDTVEGSEILALVYDNRNVNQIRTYPIPSEDIADASYTFQNSGYLEVTDTEFSSPYGVLTDVPSTDSLLDVFGIVTDADSILYLITDPNTCNGASIVDDIDFDSVYGVTSDVEDTLKTVGFHGDELLGVVTSIDEYSIDSVYGVTASLYDPQIQTEVYDSPYGVVTAVSESQKAIKIWYVKLPDKITSMSSTLQMPKMFDTALKHYIVGHALRDDIDVQYREMGAESLKLYERELGIADKTNATDSTRNPTTFRATYRGGFDE